MKPLAVKLLIAIVILAAFAYLLVTVVVPHLRKTLGSGSQPASKPAPAPASGSTGVTGDITDATRESMRKHFEAEKKIQGAKAKP